MPDALLEKEILVKQALYGMGIELRGLYWDWGEIDSVIPELVRIAGGDPKPRYWMPDAKMAARTPEAGKALLAAILGLTVGQGVFMDRKGDAKRALGIL